VEEESQRSGCTGHGALRPTWRIFQTLGTASRVNRRIGFVRSFVEQLPDILFYVFAFLTLVCGFLVVLNPFSTNPVTSAMFLVLTIASLAGLFVLLHAFFLAAVQILVYAGAVMVLFLFVIMLLDLPAEEKRRVKKAGIVLGLISVGAIIAVILRAVMQSPFSSEPAPNLEGSTIPLGRLLFSQYLLPFEVISLLLLVAMVGVILLSKKDLK
jgi:NADH-quinone oxidoreductase subunit J